MLYLGLLWGLWSTPLVQPLQIFVVLLHELSHAAAAVATGGRVVSIVVDPMQGGVCHCPGGDAFLTLSAGYLGSLVWGVLMVLAARSRRVRARWVVAGAGALVAAVSAVYVRSLFGVVFGLAFGAALLAAGGRLAEIWNRRILLVLGLTSCLYALLDIKSDVLDRPHLESDARMLAELTGVPTAVWGVLWIGVSLGICAWVLRRDWRRL